MRGPEFWKHGGGHGPSALLIPAGWLYGLGTRLRLATVKPWQAPVPVICAGNLTAGGSGKTPVAMEIARRLAARGTAPCLLTRGYGGRETGPLRVDPAVHDAAAVGDEALLLAAVAPTWLSRHRASGAAAAAAAGARVIVMDDGLQHPTLVQDLSIVVVDGAFGFGNRRMIPAGPLREPVSSGLARAHAVVVVGTDTAGVADIVARRSSRKLPIITASVRPRHEAAKAISGQPVVAFAGIARPERFFATLETLGCTILARFAFADHHVFDEADLSGIAAAARGDALLVTTEKDAVRLPSAWRDQVRVLPVELRFDDERAIDGLLSAVLEKR